MCIRDSLAAGQPRAGVGRHPGAHQHAPVSYTHLVQALHIAGVERDVSSQAHGQAGGQLVFVFHISLEAGHYAGFPLGGGVQSDGQQRVIDERVVEPVGHGGGKLHQLLFGQGQRGDDLLIQSLVHEALDDLVLHAVAHDVLAGQISSQDHGGVRAVQDAHFAFLVGGVVTGDQDGQVGFLERQFLFQPFRTRCV